MNTAILQRIALVVVFLTVAALVILGTCGCKTNQKPDAKPTPGAKSPLPDAIHSARTNAEAAVAKVEERGARAAASVKALKDVNATQPMGPAQEFIGAEATLALAHLPPEDPVAALEAEKRRSATFSGERDEARRLYAAAQKEAQRVATEAEQAKERASASQLALANAERAYSAQLEANRAANQKALDAANLKASEAVAKAYRERQNLIVWILLGIGGICLLGAIALVVVTNGASAWRSTLLGACGALCFGLAKIISHPWFNTVSLICLGLVAVGGGLYLWFERRQHVQAQQASKAVEKIVSVMEDQNIAVLPDKKTLTPVGVALRGVMNDPEKALVRKVRAALAAKKVAATT